MNDTNTGSTGRESIYLVVEGYYHTAVRYAEDKESAIEYIHGEVRRALNSEDVPGMPDYGILSVEHVDNERERR